MLSLKKSAVAVFALGSSAIFAGTMGPVCIPGSVTVPCERSAWDFGVQALYLQETGSDPVYFNYVDVLDDVDPFYRVYDSHRLNNWGWGFRLEGSYHFNTGSDVNVNWYHFNLKNTKAIDIPYFLQLEDLTEVVSFNPKWNAVNFEFGQHVDFSGQNSIRFYAGAQYVHAERQFGFSTDFDFTDADIIPAFEYSYGIQQKYNGFGPRIGTDMAYDIGNGFAIYGNAAAAVLVGKNNYSRYFDAASYFDDVSAVEVQILGSKASKTTVIPELEAKLGAKYTYAMPQGALTLDAGYMWIDYIDALYNPYPTLFYNPSGYPKTSFTVDGVYFGAKWIGFVA